jgi:hypothetical protein
MEKQDELDLAVSTKRLNCPLGGRGGFCAWAYNLVAVVRGGRQVVPRGRNEDWLMSKRKTKNLSVPAKDSKYEGRNNTKKVARKKG